MTKIDKNNSKEWTSNGKTLENFTGYICVCYDKNGNEIKQENSRPIFVYPIDAIPSLVRDEVTSIAICRCTGIADPEKFTHETSNEVISESYCGKIDMRSTKKIVYHYTEAGEKPYIPCFPLYYERLSAIEILCDERGNISPENAAKLLESKIFLKSYKLEVTELKKLLKKHTKSITK